MKSTSTFYITQGKKQTPIKFNPSKFGHRRTERLPSGELITRFTIEAVENNFHFSLHGEHDLHPRDVLEIAPRFVRFRGRKRFDYPVYQLCKTEELSADERTARNSAITAKALEQMVTGNNRQTAKNPNGAGADPKYDKKADEKMFKRWNKWREQPGNGRRGQKAFLEEEQINMTNKDLKRLIDRARK